MDIWITEIIIVKVRNERELTGEELCATVIEAAELLGKKGLKEAWHYEAMNALADALIKSIAPLKIAPRERIGGTMHAWAKRCPHCGEISQKKLEKAPFSLTEDEVDLLTNEIAALFGRKEVDGFQWETNRSRLKYHLAETYLDFLNADIDGKTGKELAQSMVIETIERLKRVKTPRMLAGTKPSS